MTFKQIHGRGFVLCATAATRFLAGCADMNMGSMSPTTRDTAVGAGVGALAGAAIRGNTKGAANGGRQRGLQRSQ